MAVNVSALPEVTELNAALEKSFDSLEGPLIPMIEEKEKGPYTSALMSRVKAHMRSKQTKIKDPISNASPGRETKRKSMPRPLSALKGSRASQTKDRPSKVRFSYFNPSDNANIKASAA